MKLKVVRKSADSRWAVDKCLTAYFITFEVSSFIQADTQFQILATEEEYNSYLVNQVIEVNLKS